MASRLPEPIPNGVKSTGALSSENSHIPRFIAYAAEDSYVDASDNLDKLIKAILLGYTEEGCPVDAEDIVIWDNTEKIAAVIIDGKVTKFKRAK